MTMPANIRTSFQVPFPAQVTAAAPATIAKVNGVWQIGYSTASIAISNPPIGNYPTDYLLVWDSIAKTYFQMPLSAVSSPNLSSRTQRSVTTSPILISANDQIINVNISSGAPTCSLPSAASRSGNPLTFKDVGSNFAAHNLVITPLGGDAIDGAVNLILNVNRAAVTLVPFNDGTNTGWAIE